MKYYYQATTHPHTQVPETAWNTVSQHRLLQRALDACVHAKRHMHAACGANSWSSNHRVIDDMGNVYLDDGEINRMLDAYWIDDEWHYTTANKEAE